MPIYLPFFKRTLELICSSTIGNPIEDWRRLLSSERVCHCRFLFAWMYCIFSRVVMVWVPSLCGLLGMEGERRTAATVTAIPTAFTPCPSAAPPRTAMSPGIVRPAPPPWPPLTAQGTSTRNRLWVFICLFMSFSPNFFFIVINYIYNRYDIINGAE